MRGFEINTTDLTARPRFTPVAHAHEPLTDNGVWCVQCGHEFSAYINDNGGDGFLCSECLADPKVEMCEDCGEFFACETAVDRFCGVCVPMSGTERPSCNWCNDTRMIDNREVCSCAVTGSILYLSMTEARR